MLLIIDNDRKSGNSLASAFHRMGILAYSSKPSDAFSEINELYSAILIKFPETLADIDDFLKKIKKYRSDIPIFAVCDSDGEKLKKYFAAVFNVSETANQMSQKIRTHSNESHLPCIGEYSMAGMDFSCKKKAPDHNHKIMKLTATEGMILRFLMRAYPAPKSSAEILKYVFHPSNCPLPSAVRTHISSINKIFERYGDGKIIVHLQGDGYIIFTPEVKEQQKTSC